MKTNEVTLNNLQSLLDYEASRFTATEIHLKNVLHDWIKRAEDMKLKSVLEKYDSMIQEHTQKLEDFFKDEKIMALSLTNRVLNAYIDDINEKLEMCADPALKDACLLAGIQEINHFKLSAYGTAAAFSKTLNMEKYATIFHELEVNEKQIDDRLSQLAEHEINFRAKAPHLLTKEHANNFNLP